jgi:Glycosyltransferases involved in cell wall biogenesis
MSLIVATKGRATPFQALLESLEAQTFRDFEVIIVDQNVDERAGAPERDGWRFPIKYLRTPTESGLSRARNSGLPHASGDIVLFPDDDCWYPADALAHAAARMGDSRPTFSPDGPPTRRDATSMGASRRRPAHRSLERLHDGDRVGGVLQASGSRLARGLRHEIGVGAATPWQACEGQDIMLRALAQGYVCWFDPTIYGHHAELDINDPSMIRKGRAYARGLGYVLKHHGYPVAAAASWVLRPCLRAGLSLARGRRQLSRYYAGIALGRLEGWRMKTSST